MKVNKHLRDTIFEIVDNQLRNNDPPETKRTYDRLKKDGFDDFTIKQLIGQCIMVEIWEILHENKTFDIERYLHNLSNLPKEPF
ncbi:MAG: hypothetical protein R6V48_04465 [Fidelibacterota bacterium]